MAANKSMFWRLIFQALRLRLQRVFIIFSALTVGASIVTAMAAVYFDINTKNESRAPYFRGKLLHWCGQWWFDERAPIKANSTQCTR